MTGSESLIGYFSDCLWLLIKEHEPSKHVFADIRNRMLYFINRLMELSKGSAEVFHTGSSFDDLHMTRLDIRKDGPAQFYPPVDFDYMMIYKDYDLKDLTSADDKIPSEEEISEIRKTSTNFALMVPSEYPGYVKLYITEHGRQLISDRPSVSINRHVKTDGILPNFIFKADLYPEKYEPCEILYSMDATKYVETGPALSNMETEKYGVTYDFVHAFPCKVWPGAAELWKRRDRPNKWPDRKLIDEVIAVGCAVVPIGHHTATDTDLQWRLSFNKAEQLLSKHLSDTQRTCYCVVKLMLKCQLSAEAVLTSYHVKNMMFWFCEQYCRPEEWIDDRLGVNIIQFISYIAKALEHRHIPHYFMSRNNLISHKAKNEVDATTAEVLKIKDSPFQSLTAVCNRVHCFEITKGADTLSEHQSEIQSMLILYTIFVQTLYKLGLNNLSTYLAPRCFKYIVKLNKEAKPFIKTASPLFCANSVPALLKPLAISCMQSGSIDEALTLNLTMVEADRETVLKNYPDVITNIACLYNVKAESTDDMKEKEEFCMKAKDHFDLALTCMSDSESLHFAYGNFLYNTKTSVVGALEQFRKAIVIEKTRADDEALIQIQIPGKESTPQQVYVDGKIASYFMLIGCLCDIGEIYEARVLCKRLEAIIVHAKLDRRYIYMQICAWCYATAKLDIKAKLLFLDLKKYSQFTPG